MTGQPHAADDAAQRVTVQSVARAVDILTSFSRRHPRLELHALAEAVGLPRSTTRRLALTLIDRGFLRQDEGGFYSLGGRLLELGELVSTSSELAERTSAAMRKAHEVTGETILVAEVSWIDQSTLISHKIEGLHALSVTSPVGRRTSLGNGCIGKAALSGLPEAEADSIIARTSLVRRTEKSILESSVLTAHVNRARVTGYATEIGEFIEGCSGVAVPIFINGRPLGAIGVVAPSSRAGIRQLEAWGRLLVGLTEQENKKEKRA
jgi:DNA-binding IclR family transcriptional regulator